MSFTTSALAPLLHLTSRSYVWSLITNWWRRKNASFLYRQVVLKQTEMALKDISGSELSLRAVPWTVHFTPSLWKEMSLHVRMLARWWAMGSHWAGWSGEGPGRRETERPEKEGGCEEGVQRICGSVHEMWSSLKHALWWLCDVSTRLDCIPLDSLSHMFPIRIGYRRGSLLLTGRLDWGWGQP